MAERALTLENVPKTYAELRRGVEEVLLSGQRRIEQAKLRTYWETGRLIDAHVLLFKERADYGAQVIHRLARDLDVSERVLYYCAKFSRLYPILPARAELTWGHYRTLTHVEDAGQRKLLEREAAKHHWTTGELESHVSELNAAADTAALTSSANPLAESNLLKPIRGTPGLHLVVERDTGLAVDLGFKLYWPMSPDQTKRYAKGDIVRIAGDDSLRKVADATKADLFTYDTNLVRVIDGDTIVVELEVSPGVWHELKLRLRGLDCPEISTPEGRAAKRFVDGLMAGTAAVVISTSRPDKYERYLADVFLVGVAGPLKGEGSKLKDQGTDQATAGSDLQLSTFNSQPRADGTAIFLNNALLGGGFAVRYDGGAKEE